MKTIGSLRYSLQTKAVHGTCSDAVSTHIHTGQRINSGHILSLTRTFPTFHLMSWRDVVLSKAHRLAVARPKLRNDRPQLFSTRFASVYRFCVASLWQDWRARECSWLVSARQRWLKKNRRRRRIVSDRNGWPVRDWTTSETKSVQWTGYGEYVWGTNHPMHQFSSLEQRSQTTPQSHIEIFRDVNQQMIRTCVEIRTEQSTRWSHDSALR